MGEARELQGIAIDIVIIGALVFTHPYLRTTVKLYVSRGSSPIAVGRTSRSPLGP